MKWFLLPVFSLSAIFTLAQPPALEWTKNYSFPSRSDTRLYVDTDAGGNVYFGAALANVQTSNSIRIAKYTSSGTLIWNKFYTPDFPYYTTWLNGMDVDADGNVCILARVDKTDGYSALILVKYNNAGTKLWTVKEEIPEINVHGRALIVDNTGNIYVGGILHYNAYTSNPTSDFIVFKYNKNGNKSWGAFYNGSAGGQDELSDIAVDGSGNVYVTGETEQRDTQVPLIKHRKTTIIKYTGQGYFVWQKHHWYSGALTSQRQILKMDLSGNLYLSATYSFNNYSEFTISLLKYNSSGTMLWSRSIPGIKPYGHSMAVDASGNSYLATVITAGIRNVNFSIYKYNSDGQQLWNSRYDGGDSTEDIPSDIAFDKTGSVYVTGGSYLTKSVPLMYERKPRTITIKYNSAGNELWVAKYNGSGADTLSAGVSLALHGPGFEPLIYVAANTVKVQSSFDPMNDDMLLLKYNQSTRGLRSTLEPIGAVEPVSRYNLSAAPNPFRRSTVIRFQLPYDAQVSLKIYDVTGREVRNLIYGSRKAGAHQAVFNAGKLIPQQYFYTLKLTSAMGEFRETKPVILTY
ncbi:MAG: SBBP repeat-containing protein [Chitinophagaceae bacterium]|nr:SBBP repeat-containing protein [Chitinophagaceae bacterium]